MTRAELLEAVCDTQDGPSTETSTLRFFTSDGEMEVASVYIDEGEVIVDLERVGRNG